MTEFLAVFLGGFLGSAHCVGMCGGLAALVGIPACSKQTALVRQLIYSAGRIFTYSFLGMITGYVGTRIAISSSDLAGAQRWFSISAGVIMIMIGFSTLGWMRLRFTLPGAFERSFVTLFRQFLGGESHSTIFLAGVLNGFLPCGLVYAFLALALASSGPIQGSLLMAVFGLGTVPAMTVVGCGSSFVSHHLRSRIYRVAACLVILTGGLTIYRAIPSRGNCCAESAALAN